jgi:hypothetical protein
MMIADVREVPEGTVKHALGVDQGVLISVVVFWSAAIASLTIGADPQMDSVLKFTSCVHDFE